MQQDKVDQQGQCSHKHRLFTLSFSLGSRCLAQLFSAFQPSLQGQNNYILTETATSIQQLNPGAKAAFSTTAKKQVHFLTSRKVLLAPAAGRNTIYHLLYSIVFFSYSHCCWSGQQRTRVRRVSPGCHWEWLEIVTSLFNSRGCSLTTWLAKQHMQGSIYPCPIPCKGNKALLVAKRHTHT